MVEEIGIQEKSQLTLLDLLHLRQLCQLPESEANRQIAKYEVVNGGVRKLRQSTKSEVGPDPLGRERKKEKLAT